MNDTRFEKGHNPWNKDIKGIHLSPETEFKKGARGMRWMPIGSKTIRQRKKRNEYPRRFIKVEEPNVWIPYAQYIWIQNNGNIPNGFILHHRNSNALDDSIDNLALITRGTHIDIHRNSKAKNKD